MKDNVDKRLVSFRSAMRDDVPAIMGLLADDVLGATREHADDSLPYYNAFEAISHDPNNDLIVSEQDGEVVGVLQLTRIPNMTYKGGWRAQIEGVRVSSEARGQGIGRRLITFAIDRSQRAGCHVVQLTTNKERKEAIQFYESLGFRATHEGMKLFLGAGQVRPQRHPELDSG